MKEKRFNLKQLRGRSGLSQRKLGELIGVDDQTISGWERGKTTPTLKLDQFARYMAAMDCTIEELIDATKLTGEQNADG